ncbi:MAG: hypothetical protein KJO26_14905, partial [Deltaproteobacteria bacterium]|nr:hypothetical protein [Deltaproteobacteria bacterium]
TDDDADEESDAGKGLSQVALIDVPVYSVGRDIPFLSLCFIAKKFEFLRNHQNKFCKIFLRGEPKDE